MSFEKSFPKKRVHRPASTQLPAEGFARLPAVLEALGVSKTTFYAGIQAGKFPKGVKLGPRLTAWPVKTIRELITQLSQDSNQDEAA